MSSYPARCSISLERRTIPGETPRSVQIELEAIIDAIAAADPDFHAIVELG